MRQVSGTGCMTGDVIEARASVAGNASDDLRRRAARIAAVLFVTATASTMAGQMVLESSPLASAEVVASGRDLLSLVVVL